MKYYQIYCSAAMKWVFNDSNINTCLYNFFGDNFLHIINWRVNLTTHNSLKSDVCPQMKCHLHHYWDLYDVISLSKLSSGQKYPPTPLLRRCSKIPFCIINTVITRFKGGYLTWTSWLSVLRSTPGPCAPCKTPLLVLSLK